MPCCRNGLKLEEDKEFSGDGIAFDSDRNGVPSKDICAAKLWVALLALRAAKAVL